MTNLYKVGKWYENKGLVGEKKLALVQTAIAISGKPIGFGIEALSGSGKSATMDLLTGHEGKDNGLIYSKFIYYKDAGSSTSMYYDTDAMNSAKLIVFAELQKDKSDNTIEAIKSMTEGKQAKRKKTDVVADSVVEQKIDPKTVFYTLAVENDHKTDAELNRRCIVMSTDISKSQTQNVLDVKAKLQWDNESCKVISDDESDKIRRNVNSLMGYNFEIKNPFAPEFSKIIGELAPDQKVRSSASHLWNVMMSVTKINAMERTMKGTTVLSNIQDLLMTLIIYGDSFIQNMHSIPAMGDVVLQGFRDAGFVQETVRESTIKPTTLSNFGAEREVGGWYDINHIRKAIKEKQNVVMKTATVIKICRQLVDNGYLEEDRDGKIIKYQVQEEYKPFETPDTTKLINAASKLVKEKYPELHEKWYNQQFLPFQHPLTGEMVEIPKPTQLDDIEEDVLN